MRHHNSQRRIYGDYVYFITCNTNGEFEFFQYEIFCELWINELRLAKELYKFQLFAFCLNYDHLHLLLKPDNEIANYSEIMRFLKRHFTRNINIILGYNKEDLNKIESDVGQRRLRKRKTWQIEMDEYVKTLQKQYAMKYKDKHGCPKFKWQKSFYDHLIRDQRDYDFHWNYTMHNFHKHGLPEDWKYTGLNYPELLDTME